MKYIYISTHKVNEDSIVTKNITWASLKSKLKYLHKSIVHKDVVFIIDVHCIYKTKEDDTFNTFLQNQHGLNIYRYLLHLYKIHQDKLKVIFYSPVAKELLIKLKPDNYVLKFLNFIQQPFKEDELNDVIFKANKKGWPKFNNASENLLSGYGSHKRFDNKSKIKEKILFLDDEQMEWLITFKEIFEDSSIIYMHYSDKKDYRSQFENNLISDDFKNKTLKEIKNANIIISDLYFNENHDKTEWKDSNKIRSISGYKVYTYIRDISPMIPVIFYTTSQKVLGYKIFDSLGLDDWLIKDNRYDATKSEKKDSYEIFFNGINDIVKDNPYIEINKIWNRIVNIFDKKENYWWYKFSAHNSILFYNILAYSCISLRRYCNRKKLFEQNLLPNTYDNFTPSAICTNLGKINEILYPAQKIKTNENILPSFIRALRNVASHFDEYNLFNTEDALLFLNLILTILEYDDKSINNFKSKNNYRFDIMQNIELGIKYKYALFWTYFQFYNKMNDFNIYLKNKIKLRLDDLFSIIHKENDFITILKKINLYYSHDGNIDKPVSKIISGNYCIKIPNSY